MTQPLLTSSSPPAVSLPTLPMGYEQLKDYLPHRYPFMLLDRVIDFDTKQQTIEAIKNVSINEPFFQGHFPDNPVMPGVLILEAMAQAAGVLAFILAGVRAVDGYLFLFAGAEKLRFRQTVTSGDQLCLFATLTSHRGDIYKFDCVAKVADNTVATASLTLVRQSTQKNPPKEKC